MKKLLTLAALLAIMLPIVSSCTEEAIIEPNAPQFSDKAIAYETIVRVPLNEGREATGERAILDQEKIRNENLAILKPVIAQIWADIDAGKIANYPADVFPDQKYEGNDYASTVKARILEKKSPFNAAYMTDCFEVILKGMSGDGTSTQEAIGLRFVWADINEKMPDKNVCLVHAAELSAYTVTTPVGSQSLLSYLSKGAYDGYVIRLTTDEGEARVRTHEDARKMEILIAQGEASEIVVH